MSVTKSFDLREEYRDLFNSYILDRILIKTNSKIYRVELTLNGCIIASDVNPLKPSREGDIIFEPKLFTTKNGSLGLLGKLLYYAEIKLNIVYKPRLRSKIEFFPVWGDLVSEDKDRPYDKAIHIFNQKSFPEPMSEYYKLDKGFYEWNPNNVLRYTCGTAGLVFLP